MSGQLPQYESPLLGRQNEIESALVFLQHSDPSIQLLNFTGPGGVGKTRLATQVAADWRRASGHNVYFVPLASIRDSALVGPAIARALDLHDTGTTPFPQNLIDLLQGKHALLLLDNFEQVRQAAAMILELIAASPWLKVLVTSRAPLYLPGEIDFPVPPLVVPDLARLPSTYMLSSYAAVSLFVQRAQAVQPAFSLSQENASAVAEVCVHLDGLPLAIELAAARVKSIPPDTMRERLQSRLMLLVGGKHLVPRHQSLRTAIDWSYDLLSPGERLLLARLAVFSGSCAQSCVEAVCKLEGDLPMKVEVGLNALADQNMLRALPQAGPEPRYEMLETIREYALERLAERGEDARLRQCHALHFLALAEQAETRLRGPEQQYWLDRLEADLDNLRAALGWALDTNEVEVGLRLAAGLHWFWVMRNHVSEGWEWIEKLLSKPAHTSGRPPPGERKGVLGHAQRSAPIGASVPAEAGLAGRAKALSTVGRLAVIQGDYETAAGLYQESLAIYQALGQNGGIADALLGLGRVAANRSDYVEALAQYEKSLSLYCQLGHNLEISDVLFNIGRVASDQGDYDRARLFYEDSLKIRRTLADTWGIAHALQGLAYLTADIYDYPAANVLTQESLALYQVLGDQSSIAALLFNLGYIASEQGDYTQAEALYQKVLATWQETNKRAKIASVYRQLSYVAASQGDFDRAWAMGEKCLELCRSLGNKLGIIRAALNLGTIARQQGRCPEAFALFEESIQLAQDIEDQVGAHHALKELGLLAWQQGDAVHALRLLKQSLTFLGRTREKRSSLECLEGLAAIAAVAQPALATWLWSAAEACRRVWSMPLEPAKRPRYLLEVEAAHTALGEPAFLSAWVEGQRLTLEQAISQALASVSAPA